MKIFQEIITLKPRPRGFHLITNDILYYINLSTISFGTLNLFLKHTSASLTLNENADPSVRKDLENLFNDLCDDKPYYQHTVEGADDMPAHAKSSIIGASLTIPVTNGKLNLGTWQGIYLNEHRNYASGRTLVATIMGL